MVRFICASFDLYGKQPFWSYFCWTKSFYDPRTFQFYKVSDIKVIHETKAIFSLCLAPQNNISVMSFLSCLLWNFKDCESYQTALSPKSWPGKQCQPDSFEQHQWRWPLNSRAHTAVAMLQTLFNWKSGNPALFSLSSSLKESFRGM